MGVQLGKAFLSRKRSSLSRADAVPCAKSCFVLPLARSYALFIFKQVSPCSCHMQARGHEHRSATRSTTPGGKSASRVGRMGREYRQRCSKFSSKREWRV